jgi:hypothetical protein
MFRIFERVPSSSVPSWEWFFKQLRDMGRKLVKIDHEGIKDDTLARTHFSPSFWVDVDGYREYEVYSADAWQVSRADFAGLTPHMGRAEYVAVGLRKQRVTLNVRATGHFLVAYAVRVPFYSDPEQEGIYSTLHIDGVRVDAATDYCLQAEWGGRPDESRAVVRNGHRLCGFAVVELIEGVHSIEVMLHIRSGGHLARIEVSVAEVH